MQISLLWGAAALSAGIGLIFASEATVEPKVERNAGSSVESTAVAPVQQPATGHFVLVIEGDRDQLNITHASHKVDPWAGVQKGLTSNWVLTILDDLGNPLRAVPLDMSHFNLAPAQKGQPLKVEGCQVRDARVAMLANIPALATAKTYVFTRGRTIVGRVDATTVNQLAERVR